MTTGASNKPPNWLNAQARARTTAIGSLPHHNIDAALAFSFQLGIPFLPQIPIRNSWEYMIAQALEGMPGLEVDQDGAVSLDPQVWTGRSRPFNEKLLSAFEASSKPGTLNAFEAFEPSAATSSSWQPFLWECEERKIKAAKIQIAGPITCQWALRLKDGTPVDRNPGIGTQIFRLVLARALGMSRRLRSVGIQPILYLDEPAFFALDLTQPAHRVLIHELKILIQTLKKEGVLVGVHCCSNTDWESTLGLGLDIISIDAALSLDPLLAQSAAFENWIQGGGILSLGVIPTSRKVQPIALNESASVKNLVHQLNETLERNLNQRPHRIHQILEQSLFTPACGLGLLTPSEAEVTLGSLLEFSEAIQRIKPISR